jgi:hypothetical protein
MLATCYCRVTVELLSYLKIRQFMRVARQHGPNLEQALNWLNRLVKSRLSNKLISGMQRGRTWANALRAC